MWSLVLVLVTAASAYLQEKPDFLKTCYRSDPEFVKCSTKAVQGIFDNIQTGFPEIGIVSLDPLLIPEIKILQSGDGAVTLNASLVDVKVWGLSSVNILSNQVDFQTYGFTTNLKIPKLKIEGNYTLKGRILVLPLQGRGKALLEPEDLDIIANVDIKVIRKEALRFFDVQKVRVNFTISKLKIQLSNLYNGLKALEESTNDYLNANWKPVAESMKPILSRTVSDQLYGILKKVFDNVPADYFIGDLTS